MKKHVLLLIVSLVLVAGKLAAQPPAPTGSASQIFCAGATVANLVAVGTDIKWYDASTGGNLLLSTVVLVNATHYYASQTVTGVESTSRLDVTVTVNPTPSISGIIPICVGATITLTGSGTKAPVNPWISASTGVATISDLGVVLGVSAGTSEITYTDDKGCFKKETVTVNAIPSAPTGTAAQTFCAGATVADLAATGLGLKWYTASSAGSLHLGTDVLTTATHYFASQTVDGCESTNRFDVTVTVNAIPSAPTGTAAQTFCAGATVADLAATGLGLKWYTASSAGSLHLVTDVLTTTTHYFASQTVDGCESSARFDVTVTVNPTPSISGILPICVGATITLAGSGTKAPVNPWISASTGVATISDLGVVLGVSAGTSEITYTDDKGCFKKETVTVNAIPSAPTGTAAQTFCAGATVDDLAATGLGLKWYTASSAGSLHLGTDVLTTATHYFASQTVDGCESTDRFDVTVTVNAIPSAPTGTAAQTFCAGATVDDLAATGLGLKWYTALSGGSLHLGTDVLTTTTHYFASQTVDGCESTDRFDVTVTVNAIPSAPTGTAAQTFCAGATVADLAATGLGLKWYTASSGGSLHLSTDVLTTTTHYFASQTVDGCESTDRFDVTVTVNAIPSAPTGTAAQTFCAGATVADLAATGLGLKWYTASSAGSLHLGTDVLTTTTHYFASQTVDGCESTDRFDVTVTVNARPTITFTAEPGAVTICAETDVEYTTQPGMSNYTWGGFGTVDVDYTIISGGIGTASNSVVIKWLTTGNKTIGVNYANSDGCAATSSASSQTTTVSPIPGDPIFTDGSLNLCLNPADEDYDATSTNSLSMVYAVSPSGFGTGGAGTISSSSGLMSWKNSFFGIATITATASNGCGDKSTSIGVTVNPSTLATPASISGNTTVCVGETSASYSIDAISYAEDYIWTLPAGATYVSGSGTNSVVIDLSSVTAGNHSLSVKAHNHCVTGSNKTITLTVRAVPIANISGSVTACQNESKLITFTNSMSEAITVTYDIDGGEPLTKNVNASSTSTINALTNTPGTYVYTLLSAVYQSGASCSNTITGEQVSMVVSPTVGTPTSITVSAGTEPTCQVSGAPTTAYSTTASNNTGFNWTRSNAAAGSINPTTGVMTWTNGFSGNCDIRVTANGCNGPSTQVIRTVSVIGTPTTPSPAATTICQGSSDTYYTTSATNATTYTWSIDGAGNSISGTGTTGTVTWGSAFSGVANITVYANGCPSATSSTTVTLRPTLAPGITVNGDGSVCKDGTPPVITLTNNQNAYGTVTITYSINGVNQPPIDVATTATINAPSVTAGSYNYSLVNVIYKTGPSCQTSPAGSAMVTIHPLPVPTISGSAVQRITSSNVYTTESGMTNYLWSFTGGGGSLSSGGGTSDNSATYTWTSTTGKAVKVNYTDGNGCTALAPSSFSVTVNPLPSATSVSIPSSADEGSPITGSYTYNDNGGYVEGTSTYRWLRDGTTVVATTRTYTPLTLDVGHTLTFEVTPVSTSPVPKTGNPVQSSPTSAVVSSGFPDATEVCIQGKRVAGETLTGKYKYNFAFSESGSSFRWLRGIDSLTLNVLSTSVTYVIQQADIDSKEEIYFEVTPRCASPLKSGSPVKSTRLARVTVQDRYSEQVETVKLTVVPAGGSFSGKGVTNGNFSPKSVGDSVAAYEVRYLYTVINNTTTCAQEDIKSIWVDPSSTTFDLAAIKDPICYDDAEFWVEVKSVPTGATPYLYQYHYNDPYYGEYGYDFGFFINDYFYWGPSANNSSNKGIVAEEYSNSPYNPAGTPWKVKINPSQLNVGTGVNYLYLYYFDTYGNLNLIQVPLNVEQVGVISEISNLNPTYCAEDSKKQITVYGTYPSGGTATWTGGILTAATLHDDIAELDPSKGIPGNTYHITYQYETANHCLSNIFPKDVTINEVPNAGFTVDPYINIEGGPIDIVPDVLPPVGPNASATFTGTGVSGNKFYPDLALKGSHKIEYNVVTNELCTNNSDFTVEVDKPTGEITNIDSKICYSNNTYTVVMDGLPGIQDDPDGYTVINFRNKKNSLVWIPNTITAQYNVAAARAGYDTLWFTYSRYNVEFTIAKGVFIDSIGKIAISGLNNEYCDYEDEATVRVLVENSTGSGTFAFTGPAAAFTNYSGYAILEPTKVPPGVQYYVSYTHTSTVNTSYCTKTETLPVLVNPSPTVSIINNRTTVNIKETPVVLSGTPTNGIFSGKGVYKSGTNYVFDPVVAGLGDIEFALSYTDLKGCLATKKDTLTVAAASGSILGISSNNQYCYDGLKDTLTYTSPKPWNNGSFSGAGITNVASAKAVFDPAAAGKGDHDLVFTYSDNYGTIFTVSSTVNVDSLGVVEIKPLAAGDEYCNNDTPFELITTPRGGVFTGPVTAGNLNPSKALGDTAVTYTYLNVRTGCSITGRVPFRIYPAPVVSFNPDKYCFNMEDKSDSIRFVNSSSSTDAISNWLWSFSDIGGTGYSSKQTPGYLFASGGQHLITLTATTVNNCAVKKDLTVDLGVKPQADFYWTNECYAPGDSIMLFDTTFSASTIVARSWNFFDGNPLRTGTKLKYPKNSIGAIPVQYIVKTIYANCSDTVTKNIYVRPNIVLGADGYYEDFESGNSGWSKGDESLNSWSLGTPDRNAIKSAASGITAWFTKFDSTRIESSSVISPCFDFTKIERPMVSLGLWRNFRDEQDGAAIQYRIGDVGTWTYVGTLDDGINWYNSVLINGKPGGSQLGWTTKVADPKWTEARHSLDDLKGKKDVKFRMAYGSNGNARGSEGMAFDDIFIGERKRNVLLEHFANTTSSRSSEATAMIDVVDLAYDKDVVNIQYHTNFPGVDSFYVSNPGDASARILYYGLTKAPYSFVDGGTKDKHAVIFDYSGTELDNSLTKIDDNEIIRRGLISPVFDIRLDSLSVSGGVLTISGNIVALDDTTLTNLNLYLAVIEKTNSKYTGANGETLFRNVFRKFVPDAAGINLGKTWTKGVAVPIQDQTWIISKTLNSSDIEVVAFIQNSVTKEVYQAASMLKPKITVGIEKPGILDNIDYALYPNPAKHQLTIRFGEPLEKDTDIFVYDFGGTIVRTYKTGSGETEFVIDDLGLKDGIYLIKVSSGGVSYGFRKLIISGS